LVAYDIERAEQAKSTATKILAQHGVLGERIDSTLCEMMRSEGVYESSESMEFEDVEFMRKKWGVNPPEPRPHTVALRDTLKKMHEQRFLAGHRRVTDLHLAQALVDDAVVASMLTDRFGIDCAALRESLLDSIKGGPPAKVLEAWFSSKSAAAPDAR
jgi:hypothetical protein